LLHLGRHTLGWGQQVFLAQNEPLAQSLSDLHFFSLLLQIFTMQPHCPFFVEASRKQKQFLLPPQGENVPPQVAGSLQEPLDFARAWPGNQDARATPATDPAIRPKLWRRESFSSAIVFEISSNQFAIVISSSYWPETW
jgi:hypothetical protein